MKRAVLAVVAAAIVMVSTATAALADTPCDKWLTGAFLHKMFSQDGYTGSTRANWERVWTGKQAEYFQAKYGPIDGAISSASLGIGMKRTYNYQSMIFTYYSAVEEMTDDDARAMLMIMGEVLDRKNVLAATMYLTKLLDGGYLEFNHLLSFEMRYAGAADSKLIRTAAYKTLWADLANSDAAGFVRHIREYNSGVNKVWLNSICK